jgi:hypothetical protein
MRRYIFFLGLLVAASACRHSILGEESAREALTEALADTVNVPARGHRELIPDKETAISFAEVLLFKTYGEDKVKDEKPYEIYKINGYWIMRGTLPVGYDGGTFEIIFQATDGKVIRLTHYR